MTLEIRNRSVQGKHSLSCSTCDWSDSVIQPVLLSNFVLWEPRVSLTTITESDGGTTKRCWWSGAEVTVFLLVCLTTDVWGKHRSPTATRETVPLTTHKVAVAQKHSCVHTCLLLGRLLSVCSLTSHLEHDLVMSLMCFFQPSCFINLSINTWVEWKSVTWFI